MNDDIIRQVTTCAQKYTELRFLLLFGSRSQGIARPESDWDFGYLANSGFDPSPLYTDLVLILQIDKLDLVDLSRASGLLRFRAVKDGSLIFEASNGEYQNFCLSVVDFWCDVSPLLQREYSSLLERLDSGLR